MWFFFGYLLGSSNSNSGTHTPLSPEFLDVFLVYTPFGLGFYSWLMPILVLVGIGVFANLFMGIKQGLWWPTFVITLPFLIYSINLYASQDEYLAGKIASKVLTGEQFTSESRLEITVKQQCSPSDSPSECREKLMDYPVNFAFTFAIFNLK